MNYRFFLDKYSNMMRKQTTDSNYSEYKAIIWNNEYRKKFQGNKKTNLIKS